MYRLTMKSGSDNFRDAAILDIIKALKKKGQKVVIYEPTLKDDSFNGVELVNDLGKFKKGCVVILANRLTPELEDVREKVYTCDLYARD